MNQFQDLFYPTIIYGLAIILIILFIKILIFKYIIKSAIKEVLEEKVVIIKNVDTIND